MHGRDAAWTLRAAWELRFLLARRLLYVTPMPLRVVARKPMVRIPSEARPVPFNELADDRGTVLDPVAIEQIRSRNATTPEKRLALDMILAAITDVTREPKNWRHRQDADGARAWLMDEGALLSARMCCESLGVDYEAFRQRLRHVLEAKPPEAVRA
jgi:hypothetical protein